MKKYKGLLAILILILPTAIYVFLTYGKHNFTHLPYVGPQSDSTYHCIPDFAFVNQFNDTISQSDYEGNIYLANFVFTTCPTICPVMTYNMRRVQQKMEQYPNFMILSHTVFPEYDTPEVLLEYANKMEADLSNWNFVTGNREDIYSIANSYFVNVMEDSSAQGGFLHSEYFVLVDKSASILLAYSKRTSGVSYSGNTVCDNILKLGYCAIFCCTRRIFNVITGHMFGQVVKTKFAK